MRGFAKSSYQRFYRLLEVSETAGEGEIRAAYLRLAKEYHPDSTSLQDKKAATEVFHQLTEARDTLLSSLSKDPTEAQFDFKSSNLKPDLWEMYRNVQSGKSKPVPKEADETAIRKEYRRELKKTLFGVALGISIWLYLSLRHSFIRKRFVEIDAEFDLKEEGNSVFMQLREEGGHTRYEQVQAAKDIWKCTSCKDVIQRAYIPQHFRSNK